MKTIIAILFVSFFYVVMGTVSAQRAQKIKISMDKNENLNGVPPDYSLEYFLKDTLSLKPTYYVILLKKVNSFPLLFPDDDIRVFSGHKSEKFCEKKIFFEDIIVYIGGCPDIAGFNSTIGKFTFYPDSTSTTLIASLTKWRKKIPLIILSQECF